MLNFMSKGQNTRLQEMKYCLEGITCDGWHFKSCDRPAICEIRINSDNDQVEWEPRCGLHNGQRRKYDRPQIREIQEKKGL